MQSRKYIELDDAVFQSKIRKLAARFKIDEKKFVAEQGALFLNDIGRFVPPYAAFPSGNSKKMGTPKDNLAGKMAIKYDLEKIFTLPKNEWVFKWAVDKFKGKEIRKGKEIIGAGTITSLDGMKKFHDYNRKPSNGRTRSLRDFQKMWVGKAMLKKYTTLEQKDVGIAKASIAIAVLKLDPTRKIPAWITKQIPKATGSAKMVKMKGGWTAVTNSRAFGLQHVGGKTIHMIERARLPAMEKRLKFIFKKSAKDSGWFVS